MSHDSSAPIPPASDREVVSTRDFAEPPEKVFAAFRDPARVAQWWGPAGFTNVITEMDLRVGGKWRLTMIAPNGARFDNVSTFTEVAPPHRVAYQHEEPVHAFLMTMSFTPHGRGTRLTWRMRFENSAEVTKLGAFLDTANQQNFDRLQANLTAHA